MKIFGKTLGEYLRFQRVILALILVVGLARLVLSLAGVPNDVARWLSMTVLAIVGVFYYGIRVYTTRFGSYKQLLPLLVNQNILLHAIVLVGISWAMATGRDNIFTASEYSPPQGGTSLFHFGGHIVAGIIGFSLVGWALASLIMWVTKRIRGEGHTAAAARA